MASSHAEPSRTSSRRAMQASAGSVPAASRSTITRSAGSSPSAASAAAASPTARVA